jgi:hypothetical protein
MNATQVVDIAHAIQLALVSFVVEVRVAAASLRIGVK